MAEDTTHSPAGLLLLGAGRIGLALLHGWIERGTVSEAIMVVEPHPSTGLLALAADARILLNDWSAIAARPTVVLAVKPQSFEAVLPAVPTEPDLVLSVMAGISMERLRTSMPGAGALVRSMPNLSVAIGRGTTVGYAEGRCSERQKRSAAALLHACGHFEWLAREDLIDVATGLSGSGPAYLFEFARCLAKAAAEAGLPAEAADRLARETLSGAGELLRRSTKTAAALRDDVTSPGGTTEAALGVLTRHGVFQDLLTATVSSAIARSRELGA